MAIQLKSVHPRSGLRLKGVSTLSLALVFFSAAMSWSCFSLGADSDAKRILDETFATRNQLKSGVYTLTGTTSVDREGKVAKYPIKIRCLFARENELMNYQHTQRLPWEEDGVAVEGGKEISLRFIRRPACLYLFRGGAGPEAMTIREPKFAIESPVLPLDVRTLGVATLSELDSALGFESIIEDFTPSNVVECTNSDGTWKIVWKIPTKGPTIVRTLHVDEGKGFAPTRLSLHLDSASPAENAKPTWGHRCEVTWKQVADTWVPATGHLEQTSRTGVTTRDLEIEWDRVNGPIDESDFKPNRLGLPGNTPVYDFRTDEAVLVGRLDELP
jgi:hypothetical protein